MWPLPPDFEARAQHFLLTCCLTCLCAVVVHCIQEGVRRALEPVLPRLAYLGQALRVALVLSG